MLIIGASAILCLTISALVTADTVDYTGYKVITARFETEEQIKFLIKLREENQVDLWNDPNLVSRFTMIQIPPGLDKEIELLLTSQGITFETAFEDLEEAIKWERKSNKAKPVYYSYQRTVDNFVLSKFHTLKEIYDFLDDVVAEYPHLAEPVTIGTSYEGRPIRGLRISAAAKGTRPVVFLECGIHAREWITPATSLYIIKQLTAGSKNDTVVTRLISNYEFYVIPSTNPDGYVETHVGNRGWRKTRSRSYIAPGCIGADPNRNFDSYFCGVGSSRLPCNDLYCGDIAFSEKESQALRNITLQIGARLKFYVAVHNFGQLWLYPYGYTKNLAPNNAQLRAVAKAGVDALTAVNGIPYRYGPIATTIYEASGSSIDWVYDNTGCKMAFALELRDRGMYGFLVPANLIIPIAKETWAGLKAAIQAV